MIEKPKEIPERIWERICHKGFNKRKIPHILKMESSTRLLFQIIECIAEVEYRFDVRSMSKLNTFSLIYKQREILEYALGCIKPFPKHTIYQLGIHYLDTNLMNCINMTSLLLNNTNDSSRNCGMKLLQALCQRTLHQDMLQDLYKKISSQDLGYALRCIQPFPEYKFWKLGIHCINIDLAGCINIAMVLINQNSTSSYNCGMILLQALYQKPSHSINFKSKS